MHFIGSTCDVLHLEATLDPSLRFPLGQVNDMQVMSSAVQFMVLGVVNLLLDWEVADESTQAFHAYFDSVQWYLLRWGAMITQQHLVELKRIDPLFLGEVPGPVVQHWNEHMCALRRGTDLVELVVPELLHWDLQESTFGVSVSKNCVFVGSSAVITCEGYSAANACFKFVVGWHRDVKVVSQDCEPGQRANLPPNRNGNMGPIAIIEARWWRQGNHSVRDLFEAVAALHYGNPYGFPYDMFADRSSLEAVLGLRASDGRTEVAYMASHGDENRISGLPGKTISRRELRTALRRENPGGQLKGLYFGSCLTGNVNNAHFLLQGNANTRLQWVAGYEKSVDWIDSSAIDMVFMGKLAEQYITNGRRRRGGWTAAELAHEAATQLLDVVPNAHNNFGFNFYRLHQGHVTSMFAA